MKIEEIGGDRYESFEGARRANIGALVELLHRQIEAGIAEGRYVVRDGKVMLSEEAKGDTSDDK